MPFHAVVFQEEKHIDCAAPIMMEQRRHVVWGSEMLTAM
jgi:hypothetical protein